MFSPSPGDPGSRLALGKTLQQPQLSPRAWPRFSEPHLQEQAEPGGFAGKSPEHLCHGCHSCQGCAGPQGLPGNGGNNGSHLSLGCHPDNRLLAALAVLRVLLLLLLERAAGTGSPAPCGLACFLGIMALPHFKMLAAFG